MVWALASMEHYNAEVMEVRHTRQPFAVVLLQADSRFLLVQLLRRRTRWHVTSYAQYRHCGQGPNFSTC